MGMKRGWHGYGENRNQPSPRGKGQNIIPNKIINSLSQESEVGPCSEDSIRYKRERNTLEWIHKIIKFIRLQIVS